MTAGRGGRTRSRSGTLALRLARRAAGAGRADAVEMNSRLQVAEGGGRSRRFDEALQPVEIEVGNSPADPANDVWMSARAANIVPSTPLAQVEGERLSKLDQHVEGVVNRGEADRRVFGAQPSEDLVRARMGIVAGEEVDQCQTLRSKTISRGLQASHELNIPGGLR